MQSEDPDLEFDIDSSIEAYKNRRRYTSFDQQTLDAIADHDLETAILDYVGYKIGDDYENEYKTVTNLSKGFQAVYTTFWVEAEVNNGGFNQYFWNSSGQFAIEAVEGFGAIGAPKHADLMKRAVAIFIKEMPKMKQYYELDTLDSFSESYDKTDLNKLDDEFYECDENLSALRTKYIRANSHLFFVNEKK